MPSLVYSFVDYSSGGTMGRGQFMGFQHLEQRVLLSASVADGEAPFETEWIEWEGQQIEVVKNKLSVGLEPNGYMINWLDNWVIDTALCRAPKTGPEPWLIEALAKVAPDARFVKYSSFEHQFSVEISDGSDYQPVAEALSALPRFRYAGPDFIAYACPVGDMTPIDLAATETNSAQSASSSPPQDQFSPAPTPVPSGDAP